MKPVMRVDSAIPAFKVLIENAEGHDITEKAIELTLAEANGDIAAKGKLEAHSRDTTKRFIPNIQKLNIGDANRDTFTCNPGIWKIMPEKRKAEYEMIDIDEEVAALDESLK